jgi:hypothetical protein
MSRLNNQAVNDGRRIRILCFTDQNSGRDVEMLLPLRYFAERFLNCEFIHAISFDSYRICQTTPDIIVTPNVTGSRLYYEIAKTAVAQNIPLFSLVSEGNFMSDGTYDHWGYNRDRRFLQEFVCCWSERTQKYLQDREPGAKEKIVLTGNPGCDRFVIYKTTSREEFLKKYGLPLYKNVIGYAGWTFNKLRFPRGLRELREFYGNESTILPWIEEQRTLVNALLRTVVDANKETLFIFKRHPQDTSPEIPQMPVDEMEGMSQFPNVLILGEEEALHDIIGVCDLWTCFESTTALEAWLTNKQTVFINPDPKFKRAELFKGSAVARNAAEFQSMIDQFTRTGVITAFASEDKRGERRRLIADSVGFGDGFNHIRAGLYLKYVIENMPRSAAPSPTCTLRQWLIHLFTVAGGALYVRPIYKHVYKLKKHLWVFEQYAMKDIEKLYARYAEYLCEFYARHSVEEQFHSGRLFAGLLGISREAPLHKKGG